ncbi:MAG: phosphatidate cytidylyltransferase [Blastococcus sp.]
MTSPSSADRPGAAEPPTSRMPWVGAPVAERRTGADTGPVPISGARPGPPVPPTGPAAADAVQVDPAAAPPPPVEPPPDESSPAEPSPGRAGRNLGQAIGVGLSLGAVILASLLIWRPAFMAVLVTAAVVGVIELTRALQAGGFRPPLVPVLVGSLAMDALAWTRGSTGLVVGFLVTALAVVLWRLGAGPAGYLRDAAAGVLVALYVPLLAGFGVLLLRPDDGVARVLAFIGVVVCSDVGGYAAGVLFGKHPMAPSISPKKSWEGMAGSVLFCILVATPIIALALRGPWWGGVLYGAAIAASATIGDLAESLIKRDLGIKDMGHLLPGHGGLMDRLDSLLPSAAVAFLLLSVLAPV